MGESADTNAAIWKSAEAVEAWTAEAERQERSRQAHRRFHAILLPFGEQDEFTFLDLGAGTGGGLAGDPRGVPAQHRDPR